MAIKPMAMKIYNSMAEAQKELDSKRTNQEGVTKSFSETLSNSLSKVNELQGEKAAMVEAFATGEKQNVHELMITLQKAGMAMSVTSAVRNKVMEAYKELMRMPF